MLAALTLAVLQQANPPPAATPDNQAEARQARAGAELEIAGYKFTLLVGSAGSEAELTAPPQPVLRWTNQLRRRFYGDVYVWTHQGRPEAIASINHVFSERQAMEAELHSLSLSRLKLERSGQTVWEPAGPGIELRPIPAAGPPADSPAARLRQMQACAEQFSASSQAGDDRWQLRLLPRPIFRYASTDPQVLDGALYAFVKGTDPDVLLVMEARRSGEKPQWQYAVVRLTGTKLRAAHSGKEVWHVEALSSKAIHDPQATYAAVRRKSD